MRIGINARYLQNTYSGITVYLLNLLLNLKRIDTQNEYTLFFGSGKNLPEDIRKFQYNYDIPGIAANNQLLKIMWAHLYLPGAIKKRKIDIFHETSFVAPIIKTCPLITTVYDLAYLYTPESFTCRNRLYFKALLAKSIKKSNFIIATSINTKKDIIDNFPHCADKIKVVYGGVDARLKPVTDKEVTAKIKELYKIKKDFILAVSLISPRKNLTALIKAWKLLRTERKLDVQLVISGRKGWLYEEVFKEAASWMPNNDIIFCGHVSDEHLLYLYNAAAVFAYPSLYEGFGLPILEAMACGCPVVSSNTSSMPEVCGDAALLVDPKNISEISQALYKIFSDASLRRDLIKKGFEQAKKFSWQNTAQQTIQAYNQIH